MDIYSTGVSMLSVFIPMAKKASAGGEPCLYCRVFIGTSSYSGSISSLAGCSFQSFSVSVPETEMKSGTNARNTLKIPRRDLDFIESDRVAGSQKEWN